MQQIWTGRIAENVNVMRYLLLESVTVHKSLISLLTDFVFILTGVCIDMRNVGFNQRY
jgi:hypothetical protein